jgi:hypothetical protein
MGHVEYEATSELVQKFQQITSFDEFTWDNL